MSASNTNRPRLSVAIIVRNAAEALAETLDSVAAIADEIVVLDTGSTDQSVQVAQERQVKMAERQWDDDFSAARNHCLQSVGGDWVLWLDAGEQITQQDAQQLREFVDTEADKSQAYMLLVKVPSIEGNIAGEQLGMVRLAPNRSDIKFEGRVRETMAKSLEENNIQVEGLPYRIHRGTRENEAEVKVRKAKRNIELADLDIKERGPLPQLLNCVAEAHQTLGNNNGAIGFYRQALEEAEKGSTEMLEAFYGLLTSMDNEQDRQPQMEVCMEALEIYPLDTQLLCAMGGYLQGLGRLDLATRSYQVACQHGQNNPLTWHLDGIGEIAVACLSLALQLQGLDDEVIQILEGALASSPESNRLRRQLIDLHVKHGRRDEALAQLDQLPTDTPNIEAMRSAIRGACLSGQKNWIAARAYLQTAYDAGCRDAFCLRWLVITLIALGESQPAGEVLSHWMTFDPTNPELVQLLATMAGPAQSGQEPDESRHLRVDSAQQQTAAPMPNAGAPHRNASETSNPSASS